MTSPTPRVVQCPICADEFPSGGLPLSVFDEESFSYNTVDVSRMPPARQAYIRSGGYIHCPNPSGDMSEHYLPAAYLDHPDPLVVALIGPSMSGKTYLLTAMISEVLRGGLSGYGVAASVMDFRWHESFSRTHLEPFARGEILPGTRSGIMDAATMLLLRSAGVTRPVAFFDVAGEDLESTSVFGLSTRFLSATNAAIFVHGLDDSPAGHAAWSFELATERLRAIPGGADRLPVVIAVTKADRMRYQPPVDRWLRAVERPPLEAARIYAQSRDVYAYLHSVGAHGSLRPFEAFRRCTLHFVSATGADEGADRRLERGTRPEQVLNPLVALLAMTGVIPGPEAGKVGLP
ncbi:hypothetical protein KOI35_26910 [Actinoplanes bogorensis]|uniref:Double-GTPase 2 domain-containing protein n=1 Tax=Paractinoplanes bogorensis TaxID=1610840 RepID=A0ABS5YWN6_9ACTN|nr:hypothetical protein [Actinoplanes bogorensis]MBU2667143.1 hypothetical protein [Actinoplanes bogorensis]